MNRIAVGTIVAKNYLSYARVLARSLRQHHADVPFFVVLADEFDGVLDPAKEPFEIVPLEALAIPDLRRVCFQYSRLQLTIVAKPYLLRYLLGRGFHAALFLDADILILDRLDPLLESASRHSITFTPHLLDPAGGLTGIARELNILQSGVYNGGFIGVSDTQIAREFLAWWADRLHTHCRHAVADGMHFDQRWLDLAPSFFDDVLVVRDPGCNVAYWNLSERPVELREGAVRVGAAPCRFFHFSGFEPGTPRGVTRYVPALTTNDIGPSSVLFEQYARLLECEGYPTTKDWPYAYASFDNGVAIPDLARRMYLDLDGSTDAFGNPFRTGCASYFDWLNEVVTRSTPGVKRLWAEIYRSRPDLQRAYPGALDTQSAALCNWMISSGQTEYGLAEAFLPPTSPLEQG